MGYLASTRIYHLPILSGIGLDIPGAPKFVDPTQEQIYAQTVENQLYGMIYMHNGGNGVIVEGDYRNVSTTEPILEIVGCKAFINQIYVEDHDKGFIFSGIIPSVDNYLFLELIENLDTFTSTTPGNLILGDQSSRRFGNAKTVVSTSPDIGPRSILLSKVLLDPQGYGFGGYGYGTYGHSDAVGDFFISDVDLAPPGKIHLTSVLEHAADNTDPHGPLLIVDQVQSSGIGVNGTTTTLYGHVTNELDVQNIAYLQQAIFSGLTISTNLDVYGQATFSGVAITPSLAIGGDRNFGNLLISPVEIITEIDTFENGSIPNEYTFEGDLPWIVDTTFSYQGTKSVRSGAITNSQNSTLVRVVNVPLGTSLKVEFYYNVSTEPGGDLFTFQVDGNTQLTGSGEVGWTKFSTTLQVGIHTLKWRYIKDASNSVGRDAVNVDDITYSKIFDGGLTSRQTSTFLGPVTIQSGGILKNNLIVNSGITIDGIDVSTLKFLEDGSEADKTATDLGHTHSLGTATNYIFISPEFAGVNVSGVQPGTLNTLYDGRNNFYRWSPTDTTGQVRVFTRQVVPGDFVTFSGITVLTRTSAGLSNTSGISLSLIDSIGNVVKKQFIKRAGTNFSETRLVSGISGNFIPGRYFGLQFDFFGEISQTVDLSEITSSYFPQ